MWLLTFFNRKAWNLNEKLKNLIQILEEFKYIQEYARQKKKKYAQKLPSFEFDSKTEANPDSALDFEQKAESNNFKLEKGTKVCTELRFVGHQGINNSEHSVE